MLNETETPNFPYKEETQGITVSVFPAPLPEQSAPSKFVYAFSYSIMIENQGVEVVQLLRRHWHVFSGEEQTGEVEDEGVVGLKPLIHVGERFNYSSGTVIQTPIGSMMGTYLVQGETSGLFEIVIPRFDLIWPTMVN
jgi:ApaG protein